MRTPESIIDTRIIFDCMYQCLNVSSKANLKAIVIPAFGGCTGKVPKDIIAKYMILAYKVFLNKTFRGNWGFARYIRTELNCIRDGKER